MFVQTEKWLRQHKHLAAFASYAFLVALFFSPILSMRRTFPPGDFSEHFFTSASFLHHELLHGRLPVWNPFVHAGHPFLADPQAAVFYPVQDFWLLLSASVWTGWLRFYLLEVEAISHFVLAGFFTYLLAYDLLKNWRAAFLAGVVFTFSGYLTGYPPLQLAILRTAIWLPLILWLLLRAVRRPARIGYWLGAAVAYSVAFLAGHPQTYWFMSYAVAAWIVLLLWSRNALFPAGQRPRWRALFSRVVLFYAATVGLSAAQLWPSLEFTVYSARASVDYNFLRHGFPMRDTWQILVPNVVSLFSPLYVSIPAIGLLLIAIASVLRCPSRADTSVASGVLLLRRFVLFWTFLALIALLHSYGGNAFFYPWVYRYFPGGKLFRDQERAAYLVTFGFAMLAAYGALFLNEMQRRLRRRVVSIFLAMVVAGVLLFTFIYRWPHALGGSASDGHYATVIARVLVVALLLFALLWSHLKRSMQLFLLTLLIIADLFSANIGTNLDKACPWEQAAIWPEIVKLQQSIREDRKAHPDIAERAYNQYRVPLDYGMTAYVEEITGASPLYLRNYGLILDKLNRKKVWRLTGVRHVLSSDPDIGVPALRLGFYPQRPHGATYLFKLKAAYPPAWIAHEVYFAGDRAAFSLLAKPDFDLDGSAVLPPEAEEVLRHSASPSTMAPAGENKVSMRRLSPTEYTISVDSPHGGLLVVSQNWLPGWQAHSGGKTVPVLRADLTFLGIPVSPGEEQIRLSYRPASVRYGLLISGLTLLILGLITVFSFRFAGPGYDA